MHNLKIISLTILQFLASNIVCQSELEESQSINLADTLKVYDIDVDSHLDSNQVYFQKTQDAFNIKIANNLQNNQAENKINKYFEFSTDQDVLSKDNMDRDYTMGVRLQWYKSNGDFLLKYIRIPIGLKVINKILDKKREGNISKFTSAGLTHSAFTPRNLHLYTIDTTDRPYAGVMVLNSTATYTKQTDGKNNQLKFRKSLKFTGLLGLIGKFPSDVSAFIQSGIHAGQAVLKNDTFKIDDPRSSTRPIPRGWPNAIGKKTEFVIYNYTLSNYYGLTYDIKSKCKLLNWMKIDLDGGVNVSVGNLYTNGGLFAGVELGWYENRFFSNESNIIFDSSINKKPGDKRWLDFTFIFNCEINYWLYNSTLQGYLLNDTKSPYTLSRNEIKTLTNFYEYGIRFSIGNFSAAYLMAFRSPTTSLDSNRIQSFGRVFLIFKY